VSLSTTDWEHFARAFLDKRPIIVTVAGPNGAGKTTFYNAYLKRSGLRFLNADVLAREMSLADYEGARFAAALRNALVEQRESFIFETVFSDPVGDKLQFLKQARDLGYTVVLCFIGLADAQQSEVRVAMRVTQGGHDVPREKLLTRFPRTLANLKAAIAELPVVLVFDNSDLRRPFHYVAAFENGSVVVLNEPVPRWLRSLMSV
jgi:predicted ABC-type ATPase